MPNSTCTAPHGLKPLRELVQLLHHHHHGSIMPVRALVAPALPICLPLMADAFALARASARWPGPLGARVTIRVSVSGVTTASLSPALARSLAFSFAFAFSLLALLLAPRSIFFLLPVCEPHCHRLHLQPHGSDILIHIWLVVVVRLALCPVDLWLESHHHRFHRLNDHHIVYHPRMLNFSHRIFPCIEHLGHIIVLHHRGHVIDQPVYPRSNHHLILLDCEHHRIIYKSHGGLSLDLSHLYRHQIIHIAHRRFNLMVHRLIICFGDVYLCEVFSRHLIWCLPEYIQCSSESLDRKALVAQVFNPGLHRLHLGPVPPIELQHRQPANTLCEHRLCLCSRCHECL